MNIKGKILSLLIVVLFFGGLYFILNINKNDEISLGDSTYYLVGDIDNDGKVSLSDYTLIRKHLIKKSLLTGERLERANVDGKGGVTASDYIAVRKIILSKTETYVHKSGKSNTSIKWDSSDESLSGSNGGSSEEVVVEPFVKKLEGSIEVLDYNVVDYGADLTGSKDSTEAFKNALSQASKCVDNKKCGSVVYVPNGKYKLTGTIRVAGYVELIGESQNGVILEIKHGKESTDRFKSAVEMEAMASLKNISFYYPDQSASSIKKYPPTLTFANSTGNSAGDGASIENIRFINSYTAVDFARRHYTYKKDGKEYRTEAFGSSVHFMKNIKGTPLFAGIINDTNLDTIRLENIDFKPDYWKDYSNLSGNTLESLKNYLFANATGIIFRRVDWYYLADIKINGYNIGLKLENNKETDSTYKGNSEGEMFGSTITNCKYPIKVEDSRHMVITSSTLSAKDGVGLNIKNTGGTNYSIYDSTISGSTAIAYKGKGGVTVTNSKITGKSMIDGKNRISYLATSGVDEKCNRTGVPFDNLNLGSISFDVSHSNISSQKIEVISADTNEDIYDKITTAFEKLGSEGGIVYIPNGIYYLNTIISVPEGVEIRGSNSWMHESRVSRGTIIKTTITGTLFEFEGSSSKASGLNGFAVFRMNDDNYLKDSDANINSGYLINVNRDNVYLTNLSLPGIWNGINVNNKNHYIEHIWGEFYGVGININSGSTGGVIKNCHISPNVLDSSIYNYGSNKSNDEKDDMKDLATVWGRTNQQMIKVSGSNEKLLHVFGFGLQVAYTFNNAKNFVAVGISADASGTGIKITGESTGKIINPMVVSRSYDTENYSDFITSANTTARHNIRAERKNKPPSQDIINKNDKAKSKSLKASESRYIYVEKAHLIYFVNIMNWGNINSTSYTLTNSDGLKFYSGILENVPNSVDPISIDKVGTGVFDGMVFSSNTIKNVFKASNTSGVYTHANICWDAKGVVACVNQPSNIGYSTSKCVDEDINDVAWSRYDLFDTSFETVKPTKNPNDNYYLGKTKVCGLDGYDSLVYSTTAAKANVTNKSVEIKKYEVTVNKEKVERACAVIEVPAASGQVLKYHLVKDEVGSTREVSVDQIGKFLFLGQAYNKFLYPGTLASNSEENLSNRVYGIKNPEFKTKKLTENIKGVAKVGIDNYTKKYSQGDSDGGTKFTENEAMEFVTLAYNGILGRNPDSEGMTKWTNEILSGKRSLENLFTTLMNSDEAINKYTAWGYN